MHYIIFRLPSSINDNWQTTDVKVMQHVYLMQNLGMRKICGRKSQVRFSATTKAAELLYIYDSGSLFLLLSNWLALVFFLLFLPFCLQLRMTELRMPEAAVNFSACLTLLVGNQ